MNSSSAVFLGVLLCLSSTNAQADTSLYIEKASPLEHRFEVWFTSTAPLHGTFGAKSDQELKKIRINDKSTSWGSLAIAPDSQHLAPFPNELSHWNDVIRKAVLRKYPKARSIQTSYNGMTREVQLFELETPSSTSGTIRFARATLVLDPDGKVVRVSEATEGQLANTGTFLEHEKAVFPSLSILEKPLANEVILSQITAGKAGLDERIGPSLRAQIASFSENQKCQGLVRRLLTALTHR